MSSVAASEQVLRASILATACALAGISCNAAAPDYSRSPVLFVHGAGVSSEVWSDVIVAFESSGYPPEYLLAVELGRGAGDNRTAAEDVLQPAVESLLANAARSARTADARDAEPEKIDIVAHSMGAASSRWYAARIRPDRVRVWIGIAGTNFGSDALCRLRGEGARQMCPANADDELENPFQAALNGTPKRPIDPTPFGAGADADPSTRVPPDAGRRIVYLTLRIEPDRWVVPASSAILPGGGGVGLPASIPHASETSPGNYLFTADASHDGLLDDHRVATVVLAMLSATE